MGQEGRVNGAEGQVIHEQDEDVGVLQRLVQVLRDWRPAP